MKKYIIYAFALFVSMHSHAQDLGSLGGQKAFAVQGSLDARAIIYSASGIPNRRTPFSYILSGNAVFSSYGFSMPLSFTYSEQDRSFSQPFNQFGISPTYKWLTVHAGYRNLSFSPYTQDGHTMLGIGMEIHPKNFTASVMYGRLNRATTVDTTLGTLQPFSFSRTGLAARLGVGNQNSYFTVSFLKAQDDSNSVAVNSATRQLVQPAANTVISAAWRLLFFRHVFIEADAGASLYTNNTNSSLQIPDSSNPAIKTLKSLMPVNGTTEFYTAYRAATGYTGKYFNLKMEYKYVDPGFQSMGVYYFNNDIQSYTVSPSFTLFRGTFRVNASFGSQSDNVRKQKESTTTRFISNGNIGWDIGNHFGVDAAYSNYATTAAPTVVLVQNKYLLAQTNSSISVTPRYVFIGKDLSHVVIASYNRSQLLDDNAVTQSTNNVNTDIFLLNYSLTFNKHSLTVSGGYTKSANTLSVGVFNNNSVSLTVNKSWLQSKLTAGLSGVYTNSTGAQGDAKIYNAVINTNYQPTRHHRFTVRYVWLKNAPVLISGANVKFAENTAEIGYTFIF